MLQNYQGPGVAEQRIAKSPGPNGSGLLRFILRDFFGWLVGYTNKYYKLLF